MRFNVFIFMFMIGFLLYSCEQEEVIPDLDLPQGTVLLSSNNAEDLDAKQEKACKQQFDGKCFSGQNAVINPDSLVSDAQIEAYCSQAGITCSKAECELRVKVLLNFIPGATRGSPCLP